MKMRTVSLFPERARWIPPLAALILATWGWPSSAQCSGGALSAEPAPQVDALRSYRAGFRSPTRLAVDAADRVYITDPQGGRVIVREPSGRVASVIRDLGRPVSIAAGAGGALVGDGDTGSVTAYSADWQALFQLGQGAGEFGFAGDIAVDSSSGNVWVTDTAANVVKLFDPGGAPVRTIGGPGQSTGQFASPAGIFVDQLRARVLVADQLNARLQVFDLAGNYLSCIGTRGGDPGELNMPQSVWGDGAGRLYVADAFEGRIQVLDGSGGFVSYLGEIGDRVGELRVPSDLAIDSFGRLLVVSTASARVEMYGLDTYTDPESIIPARVDVRPDPLSPSAVSQLTATIQTPGYSLGQIDTGTLRANGVTAIPGTASVGDLDGDTVPDLTARFDMVAVAATLPPNGAAVVVITAALGAMLIEGSDSVTVIGSSTDTDGDGVDNDIDRCAGTRPGAVVDKEGCSIEQRCPCGGPAPGESWSSRGAYVRCVTEESFVFLQLGLITDEERGATMAWAARSDCGRSWTESRSQGKRRSK